MKINFYYNSDDPNRDFDRKDNQEYQWLKTRPVCCKCGEPIQEDIAYISYIELNTNLICQRCTEIEKIPKNKLEKVYISD